MKTPYHSITLRYVHDVVTGEFANVGMVIFVPSERLLDARFTTSYERLNAMFIKVDHLHFRTVMRHLESRIDDLTQEFAKIRKINLQIELHPKFNPTNHGKAHEADALYSSF